MILSLEGQASCSFYQNYLEVKNQGTNISDSEIDSAYSEEENLMEDAAIIMNDVDEVLVEYFEYVVHEENLLYPPTNWKEGRELFIHILERSSTQ